MKTIFITISRGALIRNFFYTGIIKRLIDKGIRVVIITPYNNTSAFKKFEYKNLIIEPFKAPKKKFQKLFTELQKGAVFNKTVRFRYKYRVTGRVPSRVLYYIRLVFVAPLSFIPGIRIFVRFLDSWLNPDTEHDYLFRKYKPDLVFSTAAVNDTPLIKSAKRFGVKSIDMPKSWDNLSKMLFPIKADYLFVWNPFMRDQAIKFQGYKKNEVYMMGIPQFDFYSQKERLMSREDFCAIFGMNPSKKIILYASTGGNCLDENPYIELLQKYIKNKELKDSQILVRPHIGHPNDIDRFKEVAVYENIFIDTTGKQDNSFKDHWDVSDNNIDMLYNSLFHSDLCINVASTMTLDASACKTPVININFDTEKSVSPHWSTKRLYKSDYIEAITKTGATWVVNSEVEYEKALKEILDRGVDVKKEEKKELINHLIYKNDGKSSERLSGKIIEIIDKV